MVPDVGVEVEDGSRGGGWPQWWVVALEVGGEGSGTGNPCGEGGL